MSILMQRTVFLLLAIILNFAQFSIQTARAQDTAIDVFAVKPYLQLGNRDSSSSNLDLVWMSKSADNWKLEVKEATSENWRTMSTPTAVAFSPSALFILHAQFTNLKAGQPFAYRLFRQDQEVFKSTAIAKKGPRQPYRFLVLGDIGAKTESERKVVFQAHLSKPDLMVLAGDIVYQNGLLSEYFDKLFPIYNSDNTSIKTGAPLLRSVISVAALGNHDIALAANSSGIDFNKLPDALAYYLVWSQPLNGPLTNKAGANVPKIMGSSENISHFLQGAENKFPRMGNYSFDYGNSHWLVLDANHYMDWTNKALRDWVTADLENAKQAKWKFVCFHQPGFSIDIAHSKEQRMRLLCDIFEKEGVDVVFSGHAHDYQRSYPLYFKAKGKNGQLASNSDGTVSGDLVIDKNFDGVKDTAPKGIIYIVTGAGGAGLYGSNPSLQKTFTDKFISSTHSLTICDVNGSILTVRQISEDGDLLDHFSIKK
jgi:acid phosphatase type 7